MEKGTNNVALIAKGINYKGQIFFYQRWSELLNPNTLDTYQVKVLNSHGALHELLGTLRGIKSGEISLINSFDSIKETMSLLKKDFALEENANHIKKRLLRHLGCKMPDNKEKAEVVIHRMIFQLQYNLIQIEPRYLTWLFNGLSRAIVNADLIKIDYYTSSVVSECLRLGWSTKGLYNLRNSFENYDSFDNKWQNFLGNITTGKVKFDCIINCGITAREATTVQLIDIFKSFDLSLMRGEQVLAEYPEINFPGLNTNSYYLRAHVESCDSYSAAYETLEKVYRPLNITAFSQLIEYIPAKNNTYFIIDINNNACRKVDLSQLFEVKHYVESSSTVFNGILKVLINSKIYIETKNKLQGAFMYSNLSKWSLFQEVKFLNLWVALESFVRTGQYGSIIEHLRRIVPPAQCIRYIYRLVRNFAEDCKRCRLSIEKQDGSIIDLNQESRSNVVKEMLAVIQNDDLYSKLELNCGVNYLLKYRCINIKSSISNGKNIANTLKNHFENLDWHLQRLYRLRNEIAHSAHYSVRPVLTHIKNLRDYLTILVIEVVYQFENSNFEYIEEVFEAIQDNYYTMLDIFEQDCNYDLDLLTDGVLRLK